MFKRRFSRGNAGRCETRQEMIAETSAFLSWALAQPDGLPRIPRRRMDEGGFKALLQRPGARAAVAHWWSRVLDQIGP